MKKIVALVFCISTGPVFSQDAPDIPSLPEILEQFEDLTKPLAPLLRDFMDSIQDLSEYHPPEILPNGDIIIRRKQDDTEPAPQTPPRDDAPAPPIEL